MKSRKQARFEKALCSESANLIMDKIAEIAFNSSEDSEKNSAARKFVRFFKEAVSTFKHDYLEAIAKSDKELAGSEIESLLDECRAAAEKCGIKFELDFELETAEEIAEAEELKAILFGKNAEAAQNEARKLSADPQSKKAAEEFLENLKEARGSFRYDYFGAESKKEEIEAVWQIDYFLSKCRAAAEKCGIKFEYDFFAELDAEGKAAAEEINKLALRLLSLNERQQNFLYRAADIESNPEVLGLRGHRCIKDSQETAAYFREAAAEHEGWKAEIFEKINNIFEKIEKSDSEKINNIRYFIKKLPEAIEEEKEISEKEIENMIECHKIRAEQLKKCDGWY